MVKQLVKKACVRAVIGFTLGMILNLLITYFLNSFYNNPSTFVLPPLFSANFTNKTLALIIYLLVSGLYGAAGIGATVFYDIEEWSLLRATASHFIFLVIAYFITAFSLGWFSPTDIVETLIMLVIFVVVYFIIWLIMYLIYKSEIKKINSELNELRSSSEFTAE